MTPQEEKEKEQYFADWENDLIARQQQIQQAPQMMQQGMFSSPMKQNLVEWQLDFRPELADIEHLIRGDIYKTDERGNEYWIRNPDPRFVILNDLGVNDVIREIRMFLNKNTVLSNYREDMIGIRLKQFGHELRALIYNNYEMYGIKDDDHYKMNNYPIIVLTILQMIESAYRRAINGEERRDLNSARMVNQNEPIGGAQQPQMNFNIGGQQKKAHWYNPFTWGR